jgi:hypothetical protein
MQDVRSIGNDRSLFYPSREKLHRHWITTLAVSFQTLITRTRLIDFTFKCEFRTRIKGITPSRLFRRNEKQFGNILNDSTLICDSFESENTSTNISANQLDDVAASIWREAASRSNRSSIPDNKAFSHRIYTFELRSDPANRKYRSAAFLFIPTLSSYKRKFAYLRLP